MWRRYSAAFETLIGTIIDTQYNNSQSSAFEIAQYGWYAENVYFGKKCGLLDQTVSSYGGLVSIDFKNESAPIINKIDFFIHFTLNFHPITLDF